MEMVLKLSILVCYFVVVGAVGIQAHRQTKTVGDYVTGGQSISPARTAFSYAMTNFSAGIFIAFAGQVGWNYGVFAILIGLAASTFIGTYLPWKILAKRIREATEGLPSATIPSYLEARFDIKHIRAYSSVLMFVFFIPYSASLMMGMSFLFEQVFGINYTLINVLMAVFVAFYVFLGGFHAVTTTDFVQGVITLFASVVVVVFVVSLPQVGGPVTGVQALAGMDSGYIVPNTAMKWFGVFCLVLATGLGPWGMPDMTQRFIGIDSSSSVNKACRICVIVSVVICVCACALGACGHLFFEELPSFNGKSGVDLIVPTIVSYLPPVLGAIFVVLILSTSMSTLSGLALTATSSIVLDFVKQVRPNISEKSTLVLLRILTAVFVVAALLISLKPPAIMLDLIQLTVGAVAGTFTAPLLWGLYSKKITKAGVIGGMVCGIAIAVLGFATLQTGSAWLPEGVYGLIKFCGMPFFTVQAILVPLIVTPVVSVFTRKGVRPTIA